jgi:hypothetical protein
MNIFKTSLDSFYLTFRLHDHVRIKETLLSIINNQTASSLNINDSYYGDKISRLDWDSAGDFQRPWVSFLFPILQAQLNTVCQTCGYQEVLINDLWFQQYQLNDAHGWHVHGSNFTGVYYLDMPTGSPITQLVNPLNQKEIINPNIKEGDILIFPSFVIHRAPVIKNLLKKTIISFNCDFDKINTGLLNEITNSAGEKIELSK